MPYIEQAARKRLAQTHQPLTPGELNFLITQLMTKYIEVAGDSYTAYNAVVGAIECAKQEFYARVARPYEDSKIATNGDVYP